MNEYISRFDLNTGKPREDFVEQFYPGEAGTADYFGKLIKKYARKEGYHFSLTRQIGPQGRITFYSRNLSEKINSYYIVKPQSVIATLDPSIFNGSTQAEKIAYIKGVYKRFGYGESIRMADARYKIQLVSDILKQLHCTGVRVLVSRGTFPTDYVYEFKPSKIFLDNIPLKKPILLPKKWRRTF